MPDQAAPHRAECLDGTPPHTDATGLPRVPDACPDGGTGAPRPTDAVPPRARAAQDPAAPGQVRTAAVPEPHTRAPGGRVPAPARSGPDAPPSPSAAPKAWGPGGAAGASGP